MSRFALLVAFVLPFVLPSLHGQEPGKPLPTWFLQDYIEAAKRNSPLLSDYHNQEEIEQAELQRLKAFYQRSRLEVTGEYLFVPVVTRDGGRTSFAWNAQDATDYYGYDLGESSGHLHAGLTWRQPLLGFSSYKVAREQSAVGMEGLRNRIHLEERYLERAVTEQYLLCLLDLTRMAFTDSVGLLLERQSELLHLLLGNGLVKQSDLRLLSVEQEANREQRLAFLQSYHSHLTDLNLLCGIRDTLDVELAPVRLELRMAEKGMASLFMEKYRLDSLNEELALRSFNLQYKPRLDLFVDGGLRTGGFESWYRHFGWSAGLSFSWTVFDGRQRRWKERQAGLRQESIRAYPEENAVGAMFV